MIAGAEVLVGAVVDERFGACVTMRPGGALAEAGTAEFVAAPLGPQGRARLRGDARGGLRPG